MKRAPSSDGGEDALFAELAQLRDDATRKKLIARHKGLRSAAVVARLAESVPKKILVAAPQEALALAEACCLIARRLKSRKALALGLRAKGNALYALRRTREAVELHHEAIRIFDELGQDDELAKSLSTSMQPLILLGEYDEALAAAARAKEIFERRGELVRLARLETNVGNVYHRQDRFEEALACYERAYEQFLALKYEEGLGLVLGNMAMCLITLNDFERALETYQRARANSEAHGMPSLVSLADYNIAYLYYFRGQYGRAIEALRATREACERQGDAYRGALCYLDQSEIYLELNLAEDAAEMAEEAHEAFERLGMGYESARALTFLAIANGQLGKVFRALELFAKARTRFVKEKNQVWPALLDLYQAIILLETGRLPEARRFCQAALEAFGSSKAMASRAVLCRLLLARLALREGDLEAARAACAKAREGFAADELPALAFQLHFLSGQIEEKGERPARAFPEYLSAQQSLETLRSSLRGEELKIAFMKNKLEVYERLVELSLRRGPDGVLEAFRYVEQAKSRSLLDLIVRGAPAPAATLAGKSELVRRVGELREELNWYYHRIESEQMAPESRSAERVERLRTQVQSHENELLRALRELPASEGGQLSLYVPQSLPLPEIREALPDDALLVEYFRIGERLIAFLVGKDVLEVVPVALVARVKHALRLLQFQLAWARPTPGQHSKGLQESHRIATQTHLEELYDELLRPLRKRLRASHLIIVPHDVLHYVPFHALYDGQRHLIDSFTVSYAPSASILTLCQRRAPKPDGRALILGIPDPRAPFILQEVQTVATQVPNAEVFLGANADEKVLREKGRQCRLIHIASHGYFRGDNPMFSGIRLGGGYLTLYDLYHIELPADLITLSACVTGLNVIAAGDELLGLARGLFSAGAASVISALWDVPDESTAEFMKAFYGGWRGSSHKATAFRDAIRIVRERYPHPVHWAPFVLLGRALA
jgi:CHAT domain-containing protein